MDILFADDEENLRDLVKRYLEESEDHDFNVTTVSSSEDVLKKLEEKDYDAVVSDYKIEPMSGIDLLKELKERDYDIPFILFTGKGREEVAMEALNLGADRYVKKEGDPEEQFEFLIEVIAQEVEHYSTKDEKRLQEAYFEQLFENSPEGIVLLDNEDHIIQANKGFGELFQYDREEIEGEHINDLIVPEGKISEATTLSEVTRSGEKKNVETIRERKDGSRVDVSIVGFPINLKEEQIGVFGVYRDVTERKSREKKAKELYKASSRLENCSSEKEVFEVTLESAKDILDFTSSSIMMAEGDELVIKAVIAKNIEVGDKSSVDEGVRGLTFQNKESYLAEDLTEWEEAKPTDPKFKSAISIPIGDEGVFQALSYEKNYFDEFDLEMAEALISHVEQVIHGIRSEREIQKREEKYRTIFESANDAIFVMKDYRFVDCNKRTEEIFGVDREEILERHPWDFSPEEQPDERKSKEKAQEMIDKALDGEPQFFEWVHERPDGALLQTEVSLNEYETRGEKFVMAVVRDITERKRTKRALKESKEKIEKLHEVATELEGCKEEDEVFDLTVNAARDILDFNDLALAIADEENDEFVIKKTLKERYEDDSSIPIDRGYLGRTYNENRSYRVGDVSEDDVAEPASEEYRSAVSVPIGDIGVFQAISDKKNHFDEDDLEMAETLISHTSQVLKRIKSEKELRKREKRFKNIFDHALVGIYRTTPDGELITANPRVAEMMGYDSVEKLKDKSLSDIADTIDYSREEFKEVMKEKGKVEGFEGTHKLADGSIIHTIENAIAVKDENGEIKYYDGTMQDITELKKTQDELKRSKNKYRAIFENTGTATVIIDDEGKISLANRKFERLTGHFRGGVEGKNFFDFVVEEDKERLKRFHELRREDPDSAPNEYDFQGLTKQGEVKDIHVTMNMIPSTERSIASLIDITEKKEIMKNRDHYKSMVDKMKGMLEMMEGHLQTLSDSDLDPEQREQVEKLEKIITKNKDLEAD
ncbi:MAG: PAS domain S-box protein [Candidatus Thermoplasmatota archaeon]